MQRLLKSKKVTTVETGWPKPNAKGNLRWPTTGKKNDGCRPRIALTGSSETQLPEGSDESTAGSGVWIIRMGKNE
jgi:hypothetical protein